jgi:hypothetical protein
LEIIEARPGGRNDDLEDSPAGRVRARGQRTSASGATAPGPNHTPPRGARSGGPGGESGMSLGSHALSIHHHPIEAAGLAVTLFAVGLAPLLQLLPLRPGLLIRSSSGESREYLQ